MRQQESGQLPRFELVIRQRIIRGIHAVGQRKVKTGRSFAGPRHTDKDDVRPVIIQRARAVVITECKIGGIDAPVVVG